MQKQTTILEKDFSIFKIHTNLDAINSAFLTKILFEYVEQGKIDFELKSKKGSVVSEIIVNVVGGLFSVVLYDLSKKIFTMLKNEKQKGKEIKPVHIFTENKEYLVTGDDNSKMPKE